MTRAGLLWLIAVLLPLPAQAHLLNMTRVSVDLSAEGAGELVVEIDLGQSLMGAEAYWALARSGDASARRLAPVLERLDRGLMIEVDGRPLQRTFAVAVSGPQRQ